MKGTNWQRHWYPVAFTQDLPTEQPHGFAIHGRRYVLFRASNGAWQCLEDRCPHRAARLSDGTIRDGNLECLYHGWQFGSHGRCAHIPQLPPGQAMPERANVATLLAAERQGVVWAWPAAEEHADVDQIPTISDLDRSDVRSVDFMIDLPYEQTFLIENVIDLAHIHIAHDGVRGGGLRELAGPIEFDIEEQSAAGLRARFQSMDPAQRSSALRGAQVTFCAPNLVHYESHYQDEQRCSGLALYSLPIGPNRCRLIYRAYSNFSRLRDRLRPRWLEHWTQCRILEQDMDVVVGQVAQITGSRRAPRELWLPIKTSDTLVLAYRKWLDEFAADWPHAVGFAHVAHAPEAASSAPAFERQSMHTAICTSCARAQRLANSMRAPLAVSVVALLAIAAFFAGKATSIAAGVLAVLATIAYLLLQAADRRFR